MPIRYGMCIVYFYKCDTIEAVPPTHVGQRDGCREGREYLGQRDGWGGGGGGADNFWHIMQISKWIG